MLRRVCVLAALSAFCLGGFAADVPKQTPVKQASFHINNIFTVKVSKGVNTVRVWFAVPQEDKYSVVRNFNLASDYPVHYDRDSWGNKVGYVDIQNPTQEQVVVKEEFDLTVRRCATRSIQRTLSP